ncbi:MAG: glycyl-radical enzyme activating protein [Desulfamplus sp.]|nr:glycyl-radical enzyme activating protein [Desulfamplus sp.]
MPYNTCTIFDIKKYAIHDGPGIRTTVFFKGCPLSCLWCHNPEGINPASQVIYDKKKCLGCMACNDGCPHKILYRQADGIYVNNDNIHLCDQCSIFTCADFCPAKARERVGKVYSVEKILEIIKKDISFYEESNGGLTFSGGEPLMQWIPLIEILKGCRDLEIHTALDTTGFASWSIIEKVAGFIDLFLFDLKIMDDEKHKLYTGVSNQLILENLRRLAIISNNITIRIPLIPGVNDDDTNIEATGRFIASLGSRMNGANDKQQIGVSLLPYHTFQQSKYVKFGIDYKAENLLPPTQEQIKRVRNRFEALGIVVTVG